MVYSKSLYYLLLFCIRPILVSEIRVKMLLANQIAGFLNQFDEIACFLQVRNLWKLMGISKNGSDLSGHRTLKLTVS